MLYPTLPVLNRYPRWTHSVWHHPQHRYLHLEVLMIQYLSLVVLIKSQTFRRTHYPVLVSCKKKFEKIKTRNSTCIRSTWLDQTIPETTTFKTKHDDSVIISGISLIVTDTIFHTKSNLFYEILMIFFLYELGWTLVLYLDLLITRSDFLF